MARGIVYRFWLMKVLRQFRDSVFMTERSGDQFGVNLARFNKPSDCSGRYPQ